MSVCLCVYLHTHTYTYIHTYIHTHIYTTHTYTHTHIYTHNTYIHTHIHTYTHTYIHTYTYIHTHTHIHTYIHTYIHTHTHIHTHTYTHIHTYTHTCTYCRTVCMRVWDTNAKWDTNILYTTIQKCYFRKLWKSENINIVLESYIVMFENKCVCGGWWKLKHTFYSIWQCYFRNKTKYIVLVFCKNIVERWKMHSIHCYSFLLKLFLKTVKRSKYKHCTDIQHIHTYMSRWPNGWRGWLVIAGESVPYVQAPATAWNQTCEVKKDWIPCASAFMSMYV